MKYLKQNKEGQLLIESIVAIGIAIVGLLGILNLLTRSLVLSRDVSQKFIATYLAVEGIELIKSFVDADLASNRAINNTLKTGSWEADFSFDKPKGFQNLFLRFNADTGIYGYTDGVRTPYTRELVIQEILHEGTVQELVVHSIVRWELQGEQYEISLEDHFFDYR